MFYGSTAWFKNKTNNKKADLRGNGTSQNQRAGLGNGMTLKPVANVRSLNWKAVSYKGIAH